eukprot:3232637-Ditylum_brightwellii.AAC.1
MSERVKEVEEIWRNIKCIMIVLAKKHCTDDKTSDNYCKPKLICGIGEDDANEEDDNLYNNQHVDAPGDDDNEPSPPHPDEDDM